MACPAIFEYSEGKDENGLAICLRGFNSARPGDVVTFPECVRTFCRAIKLNENYTEKAFDLAREHAMRAQEGYRNADNFAKVLTASTVTINLGQTLDENDQQKLRDLFTLICMPMNAGCLARVDIKNFKLSGVSHELSSSTVSAYDGVVKKRASARDPEPQEVPPPATASANPSLDAPWF